MKERGQTPIFHADDVREMSSTPTVGVRRASAIAAMCLVHTVIALVVALAVIFVLAISGLPAGCGFNSSAECTNPGANDTQILANIAIFLLVATAAFVWVQEHVIGAVARRGGVVLWERVRIAFAAAFPLAFALPGAVAYHYTAIPPAWKDASVAWFAAWLVAWTALLATRGGRVNPEP
jgi:hypothetical protein